VNLNIYCGGRGSDVICSSNNRELYVTVNSSSPLLLSAILSRIGDRSTWPPTDWTFWEAFRIPVTCKEIFRFLMFVRGVLE
jgi:hypothetical protein